MVYFPDIPGPIFWFLYVMFGPHTILAILCTWHEEKYGRRSKYELYHRVAVPLAGVITERKLQNDGSVLFRYAYRPINEPNTVYIRDFVQEPKHQAYPWDDKKILVVIQVPGHNASGIEVRKLSEPPKTYWKQIAISTLVSYILFAFQGGNEMWVSMFVLSFFLLPFALAVYAPTDSTKVHKKIDLNDPSSLEEEMPVPSIEETLPTAVQDLADLQIVPALDRAEAVIARHLQSIDGNEAGDLEMCLLNFYSRHDISTEDVETTIVQATVVTPVSGEEESNEAQIPANGGLEVAPDAIEKAPLLSGGSIDNKKS